MLHVVLYERHSNVRVGTRNIKSSFVIGVVCTVGLLFSQAYNAGVHEKSSKLCM